VAWWGENSFVNDVFLGYDDKNGSRMEGCNVKIALLNRGDALSTQVCEAFIAQASTLGMTVDEASPDFVISVGGDGTMLHAFHKYIDRLEDISFVGIHTGHLGFYADWKVDEIGQMLQLMKDIDLPSEEKKKVKYPLVQVDVTVDGVTTRHLALNECTLRGYGSTLVAKIDINDDLFEMFRGDGICVSTPSGSTAYSRSLGGALLHPSLEAIQIAEMASINNRVYRTISSPVVLPKHHHCDIYPRTDQELSVTVDHLEFRYPSVESIRFQVADVKVRFARLRPFPYWQRVREAFIGQDVK
jgi:NAD+ kinase